MSSSSDYMRVIAQLEEAKGQALGQARAQSGQIWGQTIANLGNTLPQQVTQAIQMGRIRNILQQSGGDLAQAIPQIMKVAPELGMQMSEHLLSSAKIQMELRKNAEELRESQYNFAQKQIDTARNAFINANDQDSYNAALLGLGGAGYNVSGAPRDYNSPEAKAYIEQQRNIFAGKEALLEKLKPITAGPGASVLFQELGGQIEPPPKAPGSTTPPPITPPPATPPPVPSPVANTSPTGSLSGTAAMTPPAPVAAPPVGGTPPPTPPPTVAPVVPGPTAATPPPTAPPPTTPPPTAPPPSAQPAPTTLPGGGTISPRLRVAFTAPIAPKTKEELASDATSGSPTAQHSKMTLEYLQSLENKDASTEMKPGQYTDANGQQHFIYAVFNPKTGRSFYQGKDITDSFEPPRDPMEASAAAFAQQLAMQQNQQKFTETEKGRAVLDKAEADAQLRISSASDLRNLVASAKAGNDISGSLQPVQAGLLLLDSQGLRRINTVAIGAPANAGSLWDQVQGDFGKLTKGGAKAFDAKIQQDMIDYANVLERQANVDYLHTQQSAVERYHLQNESPKPWLAGTGTGGPQTTAPPNVPQQGTIRNKQGNILADGKLDIGNEIFYNGAWRRILMNDGKHVTMSDPLPK